MNMTNDMAAFRRERMALFNESEWFVLIDLNVLVESFGVTGMLRFLELFDYGGNGDYTAEKYEKEEPEPSDDEIRKIFGF